MDSARDPNKILDLSKQAKAKQWLGETASDPFTGMTHHHHKTVNEFNTAKYRFDRTRTRL